VKIRAIHVTLLLSVLIHGAMLWWKWMPQIHLASTLNPRADGRSAIELYLEPGQAAAPSLPVPPSQPQARLEPTVPVRPAQPKRTEPAPVPRPAPPKAMTRPAPPPEEPTYAIPDPPQTPPPAPRAEPGTDFSSYVEARRRARQQSQEPSTERAPNAPEESDNERARRIVEANLGLGNKPSFGADNVGGGIFHIERMTYDYAEYLFYGWNADIRRNATQRITVRKGSQPDIKRAIVRSMIEIIRRHEQGDFLWESRRLGRNITLSARPSDDGGLEEFLMREFFDDPRRMPLS